MTARIPDAHPAPQTAPALFEPLEARLLLDGYPGIPDDLLLVLYDI